MPYTEGMRTRTNVIIRLCQDRTGKVVIGQKPNLPIIAWAGFGVAAHVIKTGAWHQVLSALSFGFLFAWALLEIMQGASYFRRALGLVVLGFAVYSRLN